VFLMSIKEGMVNVSNPNRRASVVFKKPFFFKSPKKILAKTGPEGEHIDTHHQFDQHAFYCDVYYCAVSVSFVSYVSH